MSIIHAIARWILGVFVPGTGTRRASARPAAQARARAPKTPGPAVALLPAHRSPYGLSGPLDGKAAALVRPYVLAAERECDLKRVQRRRRISLVLAADFGIDLDRHVVGAGEVAA